MSQGIAPGALIATIGILGSGQLGRMTAMAAKRMGYDVCILADNDRDPAAQVADYSVIGPMTDSETLHRFADQVDVVTLEFENVPVQALSLLQPRVPVRPRASVLAISQHRVREKQFLAECGLPVTPFVPVQSLADLQAGVEALGLPSVLKTAQFGYDGKGQRKITVPDDIANAYQALAPSEGNLEAILEAWIPFEREVSILAARNPAGETVCYPLIENRHRNHILDVSLCPAGVSPQTQHQAETIARRLLSALDYEGLLCIEFFVTAQGDLLINEIAPRPHNSGHLTIEASLTSQFEQHVRAVCNLPLGSPALAQPAAMVNLLGDLWQAGEPDWAAVHRIPGARLHLYGKCEPKPGRKMGHITVTAPTVEMAMTQAIQARASLLNPATNPVLKPI